MKCSTDGELLTARADQADPPCLSRGTSLRKLHCAGQVGLLANGDFVPLEVRVPVLLLITGSLVSSIKQAPKGFLLEVVN